MNSTLNRSGARRSTITPPEDAPVVDLDAPQGAGESIAPHTLRALEFDKVLLQLAKYTSFSAGRELVLALRPSVIYADVQARIDSTTEARNLLNERQDATIGGARDIRPAIRTARIGRVLDATQFTEVLATLIASRSLRRAIFKQAQASVRNVETDSKDAPSETVLTSRSYPYLMQLAGRLVDLPMVEQEIERVLDDEGQVRDNASPTLKRIRDELRATHGRLIERLNSYMSGANRNAVQEAIITMRDGRYVIPVKADFRGQIKGIVHDQSGSGATLFIEPLALVEMNNQWRKLQLDESEEIARILAALTDQVAQHANELDATIEALAEIDLNFARAKYAQTLDATPPALGRPAPAPQAVNDAPETPTDTILKPRPDAIAYVSRIEADAERRRSSQTLNFIQARHPLLALKGRVVPTDLYLGSDFRILVITGPNTGGKTVALKTTGLLSLMAQAGMHIPAEDGSRALVFEQVFADIGDEQSIEQSLSTFSSHMRNIVATLEQVNDRSLILMDELGAGTDPVEGSALARAIINYLLKRGALGVTTTHYSELKSYAYATPGVENASVEFDVESLSPTYRLSIGLPGRSNALAIASRLGLRQDVTDAARTLLSNDEVQVDQLLAEIQAERRQVSETRQRTARIEAETARSRDDLKRQLDHIEDERRKAVAEARAQTRAEYEAEFAGLRDQARRLNAQLQEIEMAARSARDAADVAAEMSRQRQALEAASRQAAELQKQANNAARRRAHAAAIAGGLSESEATREAESSQRTLQSGDRVVIDTLGGQEATLIGAPDSRGQVEVAIGELKMRVGIENLRRVRGRATTTNAEERRRVERFGSREKADAFDNDSGAFDFGTNTTYSDGYTSSRRRSDSVTVQAAPSVAVNNELDMRGWRAEEVAPALDRYLNDAFLAGMPSIRLIHGKGTGVLSKVTRDYLRASKLVKQFAFGDRSEGGEGVTVATLVDK